MEKKKKEQQNGEGVKWDQTRKKETGTGNF